MGRLGYVDPDAGGSYRAPDGQASGYGLPPSNNFSSPATAPWGATGVGPAGGPGAGATLHGPGTRPTVPWGAGAASGGGTGSQPLAQGSQPLAQGSPVQAASSGEYESRVVEELCAPGGARVAPAQEVGEVDSVTRDWFSGRSCAREGVVLGKELGEGVFLCSGRSCGVWGGEAAMCSFWCEVTFMRLNCGKNDSVPAVRLIDWRRTLVGFGVAEGVCGRAVLGWLWSFGYVESVELL